MLDKILAVLFSRKGIAIMLLVVMAALCFCSCAFRIEDVFYLAFCGCLSPATCRELIQSCSCGECGGCEKTCESNGINCYCAGDACNDLFGCVWQGGLKDCRPSTVCDSCGSGHSEGEYSSCDDTAPSCIDIIDSIVN